jgi:predicted nucleotidyltransferase
MSIFLKQHEDQLELLIRYQVKFLLIGGYAVNLYGYTRVTGDIDIWLEPSDTNRDRFVSMLKEIKFSQESISYISGLDFTAANAFHMGQRPLQVDFLTKVSGVNFHEAYQRKTEFQLEGFSLPVISFEDLILSKLNTDRLKDKLDVEELQKVARLERKKE